MDESQDEIAEGTDEELRRRTGCLIGGLRVTIWVVFWFIAYTVSVLLFAYATRPFFPNLMDEFGFFVAVPFMVLALVVTVWLARRFRDTPVSMLVGGIALLIGAYSAFLYLG